MKKKCFTCKFRGKQEIEEYDSLRKCTSQVRKYSFIDNDYQHNCKGKNWVGKTSEIIEEYTNSLLYTKILKLFMD